MLITAAVIGVATDETNGTATVATRTAFKVLIATAPCKTGIPNAATPPAIAPKTDGTANKGTVVTTDPMLIAFQAISFYFILASSFT